MFNVTICAHTVFERSTDGEGHNQSATSDGRSGSFEQICQGVSNSKQEKLSVNNLQLFIGTYWFNNNISSIFTEKKGHLII